MNERPNFGPMGWALDGKPPILPKTPVPPEGYRKVEKPCVVEWLKETPSPKAGWYEEPRGDGYLA